MTELELPDAIVREAVPDDDIVLAYVTRGVMARYVEGVAAKNAAFREELLGCIDGLEDAGETVSAVARAWRQPSAAVVPIHAARVTRAGRGSSQWTLIAVAAALLLAVGGGYHHSQMQEAERIQAQKDRELTETKAQLAKLQADLQAQQEAIAMAQAEVASAKSDADRANAQAKLAAAQQEQTATMAGVKTRAAGVRPKSSGVKPACNCQPGDALCSCL